MPRIFEVVSIIFMWSQMGCMVINVTAAMMTKKDHIIVVKYERTLTHTRCRTQAIYPLELGATGRAQLNSRSPSLNDFSIAGVK